MAAVTVMAPQLHVFCATKACGMDLPDHVREVVDTMFDDVEDRLFPPTECAMFAAACDARRIKTLAWCSKRDKNRSDGLTVVAIVDAFSRAAQSGASVAELGVAPAEGRAAPAAAPARKDHRRKEQVDG